MKKKDGVKQMNIVKLNMVQLYLVYIHKLMLILLHKLYQILVKIFGVVYFYQLVIYQELKEKNGNGLMVLQIHIYHQLQNIMHGIKQLIQLLIMMEKIVVYLKMMELVLVQQEFYQIFVLNNTNLYVQ
jgi:hypothetical protein